MAVSREVAVSLETFVKDLATTVGIDDIEERLELARKQIAGSWSVTQRAESC